MKLFHTLLTTLTLLAGTEVASGQTATRFRPYVGIHGSGDSQVYF